MHFYRMLVRTNMEYVLVSIFKEGCSYIRSTQIRGHHWVNYWDKRLK